MKKLLGVLILALGIASASAVWAECPIGAKDCGKGGASCEHKAADCPKESSCGCPIMDKLMKKAHFLLDNQEEIGLSEAQVKEIKDIKLWAKKSMVQKEADMKVFMMDITAKLGEDTLDVQGINAMIDKGTADMAQGAKATVDAYAKLRGILTPEQMTKAKAIWKKK